MKHPLAIAALALVLLAYGAPLLRGQTAAEPPATPVTSVPGSIQPPAPGAPTQPAVAVTSVPSPASPQNPSDQIMWALAMSYALRYITIKGWLKFLSVDSEPRVKAFCSFIVAAATAAGIHMAVNGSFFSTGGVGLSITGLSMNAFKDIGFQWVSQQGWYDLVVKKATV